MKIVIELDDNVFVRLFDNGIDPSKEDREEIEGAIRDGIVLPKGHGRLIDADEAIKVLKSLGSRDYRREKGTIQEAIKMLSYDEYTSTIIEADEEESE